MGKLTKAQLEQALGETQAALLEERAARNTDVTKMNADLVRVMRERDGSAASILRWRKTADDARERNVELYAQLCKAQKTAERATAASTDLEHRLEVARLERQIAMLQCETASQRHAAAERGWHEQRDQLLQQIAKLRDQAANPDLALTLNNGQGITIDHPTYSGRWTIGGYHLSQEVEQRSLVITLKRVP